MDIQLCIRIYQRLDSVLIAQSDRSGCRYPEHWSDEVAAEHCQTTVANVRAVRLEAFGQLIPICHAKLILTSETPPGDFDLFAKCKNFMAGVVVQYANSIVITCATEDMLRDNIHTILSESYFENCGFSVSYP